MAVRHNSEGYEVEHIPMEIPVEESGAVLVCLTEVTRAARKRLKGQRLRRCNAYVFEYLDEAQRLKRELTGLKVLR